MEKIFHGKKLLAVLVRKLPTGSVPVTDPQEALQMLTLKHKKDHRIEPHTHARNVRKTTALQECLVVLRGKLRATLYGSQGEILRRVVLRSGDTFIILHGAHGVEFLEDSEVIELKNGPFINDKKSL